MEAIKNRLTETVRCWCDSRKCKIPTWNIFLIAFQKKKILENMYKEMMIIIQNRGVITKRNDVLSIRNDYVSIERSLLFNGSDRHVFIQELLHDVIN